MSYVVCKEEVDKVVEERYQFVLLLNLISKKYEKFSFLTNSLFIRKYFVKFLLSPLYMIEVVLSTWSMSVTSIALSNGALYYGGTDSTIRVLYTTEPYKCRKVLRGHFAAVNCLVIGNSKIHSGSNDGTIRVWNTFESYECVNCLEGHNGPVLSLAVDGNVLYSGSSDKRIYIWNISKSYESVRTLKGHLSALLLGSGHLH